MSSAFEICHEGSWLPVKRFRICEGRFLLQIENHDGYELQGREAIQRLRLMPRKALPSDCKHFLKPGVDICVFSKPGCRNARIISIVRRPHKPRCTCHFLVSYYRDSEDNGRRRETVDNKVIRVSLRSLFILQKLYMKVLGDDHCGLNSIEDCPNVDQARLYCDTFFSESAWMLVLSILKKADFELRVVQQELVYVILNGGVMDKVITFQRWDGVTIPFIESYGPIVSNAETILIEDEDDEDSLESDYTDGSSDFLSLRRSKRQRVEPDRYFDKSGFSERHKVVWRYTCKEENGEVESQVPFTEVPFTSTPSSKRKLLTEKACTDTDVNVHRKAGKISDRKSDQISDNKTMVKLGNKNLSLVVYRACPEGQSTTTSSTERKKLTRKTERNLLSEKACSDSTDANVLKIRKSDKISERKPDKVSDNQTVVESGNTNLSLVVYEASSNCTNDSFDHEAVWKKIGDHQMPKNKRAPSRHTSNKSSVKCQENFLLEWDGPPADNGQVNPKKNSKSYLSRKENRKHSYADFHTVRQVSRTHDLTKIIKTWIKKIEMEDKNPQDSSDCDDVNNLKEQKLRWKFITSSDEEQERENLEHADLWEAMNMALSALGTELNQGKTEDFSTSNLDTEKEFKEQSCCHEYELDEEIGLVCQLCSVVVERRYVLPSFLEKATFRWKQESSNEDLDFFIDYFRFDSNQSYDGSSSKLDEFDNIVSLIPQMAKKLHPHQKRALNFIWKHVAGSVNRQDLCKESKNVGGCIISHSPGSGKTFLIIAFIVSYLKLFPRKKPLILAPKIVMHVWIQEFKKWGSPFPVYPMYGIQKHGNGLKYENKNSKLMHVLSCLEVLHKWHQHTSILLMSYSTYLSLTKKERESPYIKQVANILQRSPGILILDEGHNPRSTKSKQRKALMEIETNMRILLSGTLFQNNFMEYFNTLWLARPSFIVEVMTAFKPAVAKQWEMKGGNHRSESQGKHARHIFIECIANYINSREEKERKHGLDLLGRLTNHFIDVYTSQATSRLPGIETYTILLKSTDMQQKVLSKLEECEDISFHSFGWEIAVTLGSVHPWLITTFHGVQKYFSTVELEELENHELNPDEGSKVKFVINLVQHCHLTGEKVLVFCRLLHPFKLLIRFFEQMFKWKRGVQVLMLNGDQDMDERGQLIEQFKGNSAKVLLASTATSAEGISLTAASRVVFLDSEWNPSKTKQAIARVYRPGQKKVVHVYQLLAAGTMEENKYEKTTLKEHQARMVFAGCEVKHASGNLIETIEDDVLRQLVENDMSELFHVILEHEKTIDQVILS